MLKRRMCDRCPPARHEHLSSHGRICSIYHAYPPLISLVLHLTPMVGSTNAITRPLQLNRVKCRASSRFESGADLAPALPSGSGVLIGWRAGQWTNENRVLFVTFFLSLKYCFSLMEINMSPSPSTFGKIKRPR